MGASMGAFAARGQRPQPSIRRRLLASLIPALFTLVLCAAGLTYYVALSVATSAYDRSLLDPVLDIAANVHFEGTRPHFAMLAQAQQALLFDHNDALHFQVREPNGVIVAGDPGLPAPPPLVPGEPRFFDGAFGGETLRIAAMLNDAGFTVQVGETLNKRHQLVWEILVSELVPTLLIAFGTIALAWNGVAHGLHPLVRMKSELSRRTPGDLRPLDEAGAPVEIAPAVEAFNRLLAQLRDSNAMQQRFIANAAHQLRTPLAGLQMHLELLLQQDATLPIRGELTGMHAATVRATRLANQLLVLAKAEAGVDDVSTFVPVNLDAAANTAAQDWVPRAFARNIDLGFALGPARITGDRLLISAVFDNLIDNALRYSPAGSSVTVRTGMDGEVAFLSVEDTGPGIPRWAHERVFERFFRVAGTTGEGSGLGLAIVREVADRHRATVTIANPEAGGTVISMRFTPKRRGARTPPSSAGADAADAPGTENATEPR